MKIDVTIYTSPNCPACIQTKEFLKDRGVEFKEVDVSANFEETQEVMMKILGGLFTVGLISLVTTVILNTSSIKLNAQEIKSEKKIQTFMHNSLKEALDKQNKSLENIEKYLREIARPNSIRRAP